MSEEKTDRPKPIETESGGKGTITIYRRREGIIETEFPRKRKPIIVVASASDTKRIEMTDRIAGALKAEGLSVARVGFSWPRDWWVYFQGIYIPCQVWKPDIDPRVEYDNEKCRIGEGGSCIPTEKAIIIARLDNDTKAAEENKREYLSASNAREVHVLSTVGLPRSGHLDMKLNYIPWKKIFVVNQEYFESRAVEPDLEAIVQEESAELVTTNENLGTNFLTYDFDGDQFVLTYGSPKTASALKDRGVSVIEVEAPESQDVRFFSGGARCQTNILHDEALLPSLVRDQLRGINIDLISKLYKDNTPHLTAYM